eukprot:scaffold403_cov127-Isochrysis_galbana.AAC.6
MAGGIRPAQRIGRARPAHVDHIAPRVVVQVQVPVRHVPQGQVGGSTSGHAAAVHRVTAANRSRRGSRRRVSSHRCPGLARRQRVDCQQQQHSGRRGDGDRAHAADENAVHSCCYVK